MPIRHIKRSPDLQPLLEILVDHDIRYIVTGSVAAILYGVELKPGDFDITPALDRENLQNLANVLIEVEATPESFGHWEIKPDGEKRWVEEEVTPEALENWQPDPHDPSTFDHLYHTCFGNFDVVPELAGDYETLLKSAIQKTAFGHKVWIPHVDDLLEKLTVPRREKDILRVQELRRIQRHLRLT